MAQTAIVTGATGNLGKAVVKKFLDSGIKVIATMLPGDNLDQFTSNTHFHTAALDVSKEEDVKQFINNTVLEYPTIDVAALLVGGFAMGNISNTSGSDLHKMFSLNFESAYFLSKEIFSQMGKQPSGGQIFLVGARPALVAEAGKEMIAYALSKSLIFKLAELLNAADKKKNIITSVIVPSTLDTPQNRTSMPDANFSNWVKPEDVAEVIYFAVSEPGKILREPIIKVYGNA
jgi:NAD(P)-dependent dehydrogenase (short-subunit alcohol dehydrogenase family)